MRQLRIALVLYFAPRKLGSMEAWLVALACRLRERGHTVTAFGREPVHPEVKQALRDAGVEWAHVDRLGEGGLLRTVRRLRRFDVVHLSFASPHGRLALAAYLAWPTRILMVDHNSRRDAELLSHFDGMRPPPQAPGRFKNALVTVLARRRLSGVAGVSHYVRVRAKEELKLSDPQARTIYNGVDLERFRPNVSEKEPDRVHKVLSIAHLIPEKGIEFLLRAVARLDSRVMRFMVVGDGTERAKLERLTGELEIEECVEFVGLRDDTDCLLRTADVFVHPAVWGEAFGLAIAEAMASGCPVVASDVGAIPELIEDGVSGLLVPPGDVAALSAAILRLIADPALRRNLATAARERVEDSFGLERSVQAHVDWCE